MFRIGLNYAFRNIVRTPLRTFLTVFSIAMVISLYTLLTAMVDSFTVQIKNLLQQESIDVIVQSKFAITPMSSSISDDIVQQINELKSIKSNLSVIVGPKSLEDHKRIFLIGINNFSQIAASVGLTLQEGRLYEKGKKEIVIAKRLLKSQNIKLNDEIYFPEEGSFKVVGTYESWMSFLNSSVIGDLNTIRVILNKPQKTNVLFLSLHDPHKREKIIEEINKKFPTMAAVKSSEFSQTLGEIRNIFYIFDIITLITLIIALAILINTFLVAVNERTKEIAILSAIGWHQNMILYIFIIESICLALMGGVLGFFISVGMLHYVQITHSGIMAYLPESLDAIVFTKILLVSIIIAMISVLLPAWRISKMTIAKVLKNG